MNSQISFLCVLEELKPPFRGNAIITPGMSRIDEANELKSNSAHYSLKLIIGVIEILSKNGSSVLLVKLHFKTCPG